MFDIYKGKRIIITGHTGYKSSWLGFWLKRLGATVMGISHPPQSSPNHYELLDLHSLMDTDIHADITEVKEIDGFAPDLVIHLAARAIVAKTFDEPEPTFFHNVMGTVHLLELCRSCPSLKGVVIATTDKVYEDERWRWGYRENDKLGGVDPYSASKVCIEQVIRCYREAFKMNIATARAGNVIGGGDWSYKRLIPDIVRAASKGEKVVVHTPNATRPFQHVLDALAGYLILGKKILEGDSSVNRSWNFGPTGSMSVLEVLKIAKEVWPAVDWVVDETPTHPYMVYLLKLDSTEARKYLGWEPRWTMEESIRVAINWYRAYYGFGIVCTDDDICDYERSW